MNKKTYERHYKILSVIRHELEKQLRVTIKDKIKNDIVGIIETIDNILNNLGNYSKQLFELRNIEKELVDIINDFKGINDKISIIQISKSNYKITI